MVGREETTYTAVTVRTLQTRFYNSLTLLAPGYLGCIEAPGVAPEATPIEMPFLFRYKP